MTEDSRVEVEPKYWGDVLQAFTAGVQLDLRVRLAIEFIKSPYFEGCPGPAREVAGHALDLATALVEESAARGLVKALPDTGEIAAPMRHHIERSARAQVFGQVAAQRAVREEAGGVLHPAMNG